MANQHPVRDRRGLIVALVIVVVLVAAVAAAVASAGGADDTASAPPSSVTATPGVSSSPSAASEATPEPTGSLPIVERPTESTSKEAVGPEAGSLETVPVEELVIKEPVELDEVGTFGTGLSMRVVRTEAVTGESRVRGEIAGPAVQVTLKATNNTKEEISLARSQVEVTFGDTRSPGVALSGPGVKPFAQSLAPGESAQATYVYGIPEDERDLVQIVVFYSTDAPIVVFEGTVP